MRGLIHPSRVHERRYNLPRLFDRPDELIVQDCRITPHRSGHVDVVADALDLCQHGRHQLVDSSVVCIAFKERQRGVGNAQTRISHTPIVYEVWNYVSPTKT